MKYIISIFIISFLIISCVQKGVDYQKNYERNAIFFYLIKSSVSARATCEEMSKIAGSCLFQASDKPPLPNFITEEYYGANVLGFTPNGGTDTYQNYCENAVKSESLKNWSEIAKECLFSCQKTYWQTLQRLEDCNKKTTEELLKGITSGTNVCIIKCFRVTSN